MHSSTLQLRGVSSTIFVHQAAILTMALHGQLGIGALGDQLKRAWMDLGDWPKSIRVISSVVFGVK